MNKDISKKVKPSISDIGNKIFKKFKSFKGKNLNKNG